jgi:putative tricarboxylic transport membrane protein
VAVEIIAGTPPGGGQDRAARALAAALGFETFVTNVPGRGGGNGWDRLHERRADPGVVSISSPTLITNKLQGEAEIDDRDLTPLAHLCTEYLAFVTGADRAVCEPGDVLAAVRFGETFSLATAKGNVNHMAIGMIADHHGVDPAGVPVRVFDSARHAIADVVEGGSAIAVVSAASVLPEIDDGSVRVLAMTSPTRMAGPFAEVPTWTEERVPCVIGTWRGLIAPPDLGEEHVAFWNEEVARAITSEQWRIELSRNHWIETHLDAAGTRRFLDEQRSTLGKALEGLARG